MKKAILSAICGMLGAALLTGCGAAGEALQSTSSAAPVTGKAADQRFTAAQDSFALDLLRETQNEKENENVMVSPYSVTTALAMIVNGAAGQTLSESEAVLGSGIPIGELNQYLCEWRQHQPARRTCKLLSANAIWFRNEPDLTVKDTFPAKCRQYFDADAFKEPFDDSTVGKINKWTAKHTDNMIPQLVDDLGDSSVVLTNAVCFDAKWRTPYKKDDISDGSFTAADGSVQDAVFMSSTEECWLEADDGACGFLRPYDGDCAFVGILPPEGISAQEYLNTLTAEQFEKLLSSGGNVSTCVKIPQFSYDTECQLKQVLMKLGMETAFTPEADFSGISDTPLFISQVLHKTHIEVDPNGTKASAATAVMMTKNSVEVMGKTVILDRPFLYVILDTQNNLPLFFGTVNSISQDT